MEANADRGTVDLSPDGKRLAVIERGTANPVQLWDVDSGKTVGTLGAKLRSPIRFSPDGKWLAAATGRTEVEIWDLASKKKLRGWNAHEVELRSIAFSGDSRLMLTSDGMGKVHLWDAGSGRKLREFKPLSWDPSVWNASRTAFSVDGKFLAIVEAPIRPSPTPIANPTARISVWDTATGKLLRELTCPSREYVRGCAESFRVLTLAPDGKKLITMGPDHFLRLWDPATGQELRRVPLESSNRPCLLTLSKDGNLAAISADLSSIALLDLSGGKPKLSPGEGMHNLHSALLTPDGRTALTEGPENSILVWDATAGRVRRQLQGHKDRIRSLQLSEDGRTLYSVAWDKTLRVWDLAGGEERKRIKVEMGLAWSRFDPVVSPDGKTMIASKSTETIRVLDMATGQEREHFQLERLCGMILSADGRSLVACSSNGQGRLWDVAGGRTRRDFRLPVIKDGVQVYSMALSPDGRLLAIGSPHLIGAEFPKQHFLLLLDLETGHEVYRFENLSLGVDVLAFSPDGCILAWGGFEHPAIRLLETATGRERRRLTGHRGAVASLSFSADGQRLLSGSYDTTALVWELGSSRTDRPSTAEKVEKLWTDLAGEDAARAYAAIHKLAAAPNAAIPFLRKHLSPVPVADKKRVARLIADLDSDDFVTRQRATGDLEKLGEQALPTYRQSLEGKPSLETRRRLEDLQAKAQATWWDVSGQRLRSLRAIEALELAGTKEAREVLETLAAGAEGARLTKEAKTALERLAKRRLAFIRRDRS